MKNEKKEDMELKLEGVVTQCLSKCDSITLFLNNRMINNFYF